MDKCPKCGEKDYEIIEYGFYKCKKCGNIWKYEKMNNNMNNNMNKNMNKHINNNMNMNNNMNNLMNNPNNPMNNNMNNNIMNNNGNYNMNYSMNNNNIYTNMDYLSGNQISNIFKNFSNNNCSNIIDKIGYNNIMNSRNYSNNNNLGDCVNNNLGDFTNDDNPIFNCYNTNDNQFGGDPFIENSMINNNIDYTNIENMDNNNNTHNDMKNNMKKNNNNNNMNNNMNYYCNNNFINNMLNNNNGLIYNNNNNKINNFNMYNNYDNRNNISKRNYFNNNLNNTDSNIINDNKNDMIGSGGCENEFHKIKKEREENEEKFLINIKFFELERNINYEKKNLSSLLKLCLMKYLSQFVEDKTTLDKLSPEIKTIILKLRNSLEFTKDNQKNMYNLLKENKGNNIIIYSQYINEVVNTTIINSILNLLEDEKRTKIDNYWRCLSKYEEYSSFFEQELIKDLKKTKFDYSIIGLGIVEKKDEDEENYKLMRNSCPNMEKRILYHGSQIDPISKILTSEFKYSRRPFYGMGIYFSDIIDYVAFYTGGKNFDDRRAKFGNIVPVNSTFSFIASEVFYDRNKFKQIKDDSLYVSDIDHFPSYEELIEKYGDKMVEPNGIHFIRVDNEGDSLTESCFLRHKKKGEFLGNEYAITEKYQILPIYSLTIKRNEYFILWRDPNFEGENQYSDYLLKRKLFCIEKAKMNIYFESSTEEALKFLQRRKYNKVILITSIGLDLSGKRFIEVSRKILGFNVMVLFFSANENHLKWIKNFHNSLYTDTAEIYEEYISNFNEQGLKSLKMKVEKEYKTSLMEFSDDFLSYPNFKNEAEYSKLNFSYFNPYIRSVKIYCKNKDEYLYINQNKKSENNIWDITIIEDEITLFLNGNYLDVDKDNETITACKYMKIWKFKKTVDEQYYFIYPNKKNNNILSTEGNVLKVNKEKPGKNELFQLIDVTEN